MTLDVKCVDRLYLNGYIPRLQHEGGVVAFQRQAGAAGRPIARDFGRDHESLSSAVAGLV